MQLTLDRRAVSFASKVIVPRCEVGDVKMGSISEFIERNFRHFNAAVLKDAADAYLAHLDRGGTMVITLAGAMGTPALGVAPPDVIPRHKKHDLPCTGWHTWVRLI